jgi:hypothetical protein
MLNTESRIGRPKTSPLTRKEQLALAQQRKRDLDKKAGLKPLNVNVSSEAKGFADVLCQIHNLTQKELIERLLDRAIRNGSLMV